MIKVFYSYTDELKKDCSNISELVHLIPSVFHIELNKYKKNEYKYSYVTGILLVKRLFEYFKYNPDDIKKISRNDFGKPYIDNNLSFNISNSGNLVICAGALDCKVGIDIEKVRPVNIKHFKKVFTSNEMKMIKNATNHSRKFFELWTKKESVMKADGRGLTINPKDIKIENCYGDIEESDKRWYIKQIKEFKDYIGCICSSKPKVIYDIEKFVPDINKNNC